MKGKCHLQPDFRQLLEQFDSHIQDLLQADQDPDGFPHRCDEFTPLLLDFAKYMMIRKRDEIFYEV